MRNTSSDSSPADKRRKLADSSEDEGTKPTVDNTSMSPPANGTASVGAKEEVGSDSS